jgi:hypothetical protein
MATHTTINLIGTPRDDLLVIADRACSALASIASNLTSDEGARDDTEEEIGLDYEEVVEMAHDNMIGRARRALDKIVADFPAIAAPEKPNG